MALCSQVPSVIYIYKHHIWSEKKGREVENANSRESRCDGD